MKAALPVLVAAWASMASAGLIARAVEEDHSPPHPVGLLGWKGPVTEGGPDVYYEGTDLDDIDAKIQAEHGVSIWDGSMEFASNSTAEGVDENPSSANREMVRIDDRGLEARQDSYRNICGLDGRWGGVAYWDVDAGIRHLRTVSQCIVQARQCIRNTCNGASAIAFCNDNTYALVMACSHIANMASDLLIGCAYTTVGPFLQPAAQRFNENQQYNVITARCSYFSPSGQPV